jgi:hypothetical protein
MTGLTLVTLAIVAAVWLAIDRRAMPAIEHYSRSEWYLAAVPGIYAVGLLILVGWIARGAYRSIIRPRYRRSARPIDGIVARSTM